MGDPTGPASKAHQSSSSSSASASGGGDASTAKATAPFPRQRSRGQLARRNSITKGSDASRHRRRGGKRRADAMMDARHPTSPSSIGRKFKAERPWLGGLFFTDLVFIAFTYSINLLRTCGLAELADVAFKGLAYVLTRLPYDLYQRWTLSTPPASHTNNRSSTSHHRKKHRRRRTVSKLAAKVDPRPSPTRKMHNINPWHLHHQLSPSQRIRCLIHLISSHPSITSFCCSSDSAAQTSLTWFPEYCLQKRPSGHSSIGGQAEDPIQWCRNLPTCRRGRLPFQ